MSKKKFSLEFDGLEEMIKQFSDLGADIIPVGTKALEASHDYITPLIHEKMSKSNLPAKGKYSKGQSESQIIDDKNVEWSGFNGTIDIGFSLDEGITPIFLMYGGNHSNPVKGLKSTIYGTKTKEEIAKIQEEVFAKELDKVMNSGR